MPIPENPTIKIAFTGLLAFCFDAEKKNCQVGILRKESHELRIKVFKVTSTRFEELTDLSRKVSDAARVTPGAAAPPDISLKVVHPRTEGITLYTNGPFARDESDDVNDFRWIPDIEGPEFHDRKLDVNAHTLTPSFRLNNGLFYTALKVPARKIREATAVIEMDVASFTGANIYMDQADSEAILTFGTAGESFSFRKEDDTAYKIQVFNDCVDPIPPVIPGDFRFYYDAFKVPSASERFNLVGPPSASGVPDTHRSPCGPCYSSITTEFI